MCSEDRYWDEAILVCQPCQTLCDDLWQTPDCRKVCPAYWLQHLAPTPAPTKHEPSKDEKHEQTSSGDITSWHLVHVTFFMSLVIAVCIVSVLLMWLWYRRRWCLRQRRSGRGRGDDEKYYFDDQTRKIHKSQNSISIVSQPQTEEKNPMLTKNSSSVEYSRTTKISRETSHVSEEIEMKTLQ